MPRGDVQLQVFAESMAHELDSNAHKGNWLEDSDTGQPLTDEQLLHELLYHASKLATAMARGDKQAILQYAADVGNCSWFIADKFEALDTALLTTSPIEYGDEPVDTAQGFAEKKRITWDLAKQMLVDVPNAS